MSAFLAILLLGSAFAGPRLLAGAASQQAEVPGRRYALVVGPSDWSDSAIPDLRYADDDALALSVALSDPARGRFDRVWVLTRPEDTTVASVRRALSEMAAVVRSPDDTVLLYFSTHGTLARDETSHIQQLLLLSDSQKDDPARSGLRQSEVLDWLEGLPSRRKVVLFATCHSGRGKSALSKRMEEELASTKGEPVVSLRSVSEATVIIGVCAWNETASESEALGHDVYTAFFLQALAAGDRNGDGAVTVTEAHDQARAAAWGWTHGAQRAWARADVLGEDPIVLSGERAAVGAPVLGSYRAGWDGYRLQVDGQEKGVLPGQFDIPAGPHRVELLPPTEDRVVARQRVRLQGGTRLDVDQLFGSDPLRLGAGFGVAQVGPEGLAPTLMGELHLPRLLPHSFELIGEADTTLRWPHPSLSGSLVVEHSLRPGPLQLRLGAGLRGWLLQNAEGTLLEPSISPVPSISVGWLPAGPFWLRFGATGGWFWTTEAGELRSSWAAEAGLRAGLRLNPHGQNITKRACCL